MARRLRVEIECDLCGEAASRVGISIAIGKAKPRVLDLCERDFKVLVQPVLDVLAEYGFDPAEEVPEPQNRHRHGWKRKLGPLRCQAGCGGALLKTATTLEVHLKHLHGMTLEEYIAQYGELVPLTPEEQAEVVEIRCAIEGCDQVYSTALGNRYPQQAMVSHLWGHHMIKWRPGTPLPSSRP